MTTTEKKKQIPKNLRMQVWQRWIGSETTAGQCFACGIPININAFDAGHNVPESKGGTATLDNLRPVCHQCNLGMGNVSTIEEYRKLMDFKTNIDVKKPLNQGKQAFDVRDQRRFKLYGLAGVGFLGGLGVLFIVLAVAMAQTLDVLLMPGVVLIGVAIGAWKALEPIERWLFPSAAKKLSGAKPKVKTATRKRR